MTTTPQELMNDLVRAQKRVAAKDSKIVDRAVRSELVENVYPLIREVMEAVFGAMSGLAQVSQDHTERLGLAEATIAEYLTSVESMILPDLADRICATLAMARDICAAVEDGADAALKGKIATFLTAAAAVDEEVEAVRLEEEELDDDAGAEDTDPGRPANKHLKLVDEEKTP